MSENYTILETWDKCVSSEEVCKILHNHAYDRVRDNDPYGLLTRVIKDEIEELPSVTPILKIGKDLGNGFERFICSECGIELADYCKITYWGKSKNEMRHEYHMRFCPECGTKIYRVIRG